MLHLWFISAAPVLARDALGTDVDSIALGRNSQIAEDLDVDSSSAKLLYVNLGILYLSLSHHLKGPIEYVMVKGGTIMTQPS
ncbi:unnamed protein product [Clonostachys rosea f. rosea IK726]|uniref:Uncharacterized protein n=2 Tax=Bionectria ochroleuca TaxID=29856 RepID=A0A0B7JQ92_BIOOC|nr:unnamed protein product [Clonostachys rosea f. rosea IK726]